jgi:hypothetical protein
VLTRRVRVERQAGSGVQAVSLVVYENLSPSLSRVPQLPLADWAFDSTNDFLAAWDPGAQAILHFHPGDRAILTSFVDVLTRGGDVDFGTIETLMQSQDVSTADAQAFVEGLDAAYPPGVCALVTTEPEPESFQVGADSTPLCVKGDELVDNLISLNTTHPDIELPFDEDLLDILRCQDKLSWFQENHNWLQQPEDALADLQDGVLAGSLVSAAQTNGALMTPLAFDGEVAEGSVVFAFGETRAEALTALDSVRGVVFEERLRQAEGAFAEVLDGVRFPGKDLGEQVRRVAKRAILNIYVARVERTGAMVASITRQRPYHLDWPRDGAFFSMALDVAGLRDWVTQRTEWYLETVREEPAGPDSMLNPEAPVDPDSGAEEFPAWAWEMNYYGDGETGGPTRFEIDNTALHVWSTVMHAAFLSGGERRRFAERAWPTTKKSLDLLERWKEADTGLPAPASEDDNQVFTSSLHGAVTVHAALVAGARLARYMDDDQSMERYLLRAEELNQAIRTHYLDPSAGLFKIAREDSPAPIPDKIGYQVTGWLVWPGRVLSTDEALLQAQLEADMDEVLSILKGEREWGIYLAKPIIAAALYGKKDGARAQAREALLLLADVATEGTDHFGEVFENTPTGLQNRVSMPHVWEGALFYLAAMALTDPDAFDRDKKQFPLPGESTGESCSCGGQALAPAPVWLLLIWLVRRRRNEVR